MLYLNFVTGSASGVIVIVAVLGICCRCEFVVIGAILRVCCRFCIGS